MIVIVFWAMILTIVSFLYLCVCVDGNSGSPLAILKNFMFDTLPARLKAFGHKTCGERFVSVVLGVVDYIFYKRNPLVQIVYLLCAVGGFAVYVKFGFCHVPGPYIAGYHKITGSLLMSWCYWSYYKACTVSPGLITKTDKEALKRFPYDNFVYTKGNECKTCLIDKPARSKHCRMCDQCVERFDHHCIWVNQCIGLRNYKFFLMFLFFHAWLCTYGVVAGVQILRGIVKQQNLENAVFIDEYGKYVRADNWIIFTWLMQEEQHLFSVVMLCFAVAIMLHCFWIYHFSLIRQGLTTNEHSKRGSLLKYLTELVRFLERYRDGKIDSITEEDKAVYLVTGDETRKEILKQLECAK